MEIVQHHDEAGWSGCLHEPRGDRLEQPVLLGPRVVRRDRRGHPRDLLPEIRDEPGELTR
jgi:hypothetical protein